MEKTDLEDIDVRSPALHTIDIFSQTTYHQNWVILAFIGAELAGGTDSAPPPSRACNSEPLSHARVKKVVLTFGDLRFVKVPTW